MKESHTAVTRPKAVLLKPRQAMRLAWGFFRIGLGIALVLLLGGGAVRIAALERVPLPSFMPGLALILWGLFAFRPPDQLTPVWTRLTRRAAAAGILLMYFTPFAYWWVAHSHAVYLTINMLGFCLCLIGLLLFIGQLASETGAYCRDEMFQLEAQISSWAVLILLGLPFLIALAFGTHFFIKHQGDPFAQLQKMYFEAPLWIRSFFIIPAAMTIMTVFKAGCKFYEHIDASG